MTGAMYTSAPSAHISPRTTAATVPDDGRLGIADVTQEYGLTAVYERIAQLRATGQRHAALAIERELALLGSAYPKAG